MFLLSLLFGLSNFHLSDVSNQDVSIYVTSSFLINHRLRILFSNQDTSSLYYFNLKTPEWIGHPVESPETKVNKGRKKKNHNDVV